MSAVPGDFMRVRSARLERAREPVEQRSDSFWGWIAVGMLVVCWIAEASLCALRGF